MKKILFTAYDLGIGGIEKSLINLLDNLNYNKYDVTLILEKKEGEFLNKLNKNVKVFEYRVSTNKNVLIRKSINFIKRLKFMIKNYHKFDFSCCYATYSIPGSKIALIASSNSVLFVHNNYKYTYDEKNLRNFFDTRKINKFKKIIFVSNEARNDLLIIYPELRKKSLVINNLINCSDIIKLSGEKINLKKGPKKLFVYVGRLDEKQKKITRLITVFKNLNENLWIIGDGPDYNLYKNKIGDCKNIVMLGSKKNPYPYIKLANYIILTSDYEGFPVVYNEAILLNTKIITTIDVSDDYISIKDRFGYIIDKDVHMIQKQLEKILKSDDLKTEKVDFKKLNSDRVKKIEKIIEGKS